MKVTIATGASGGHLFPAIEVAEYLRSERCEVQFVGAFRIGQQRILDAGFTLEALDVRAYHAQTWGNKTLAICSYIRAIIRSIRILLKNKTDVVIGFGGYGSFSTVLAGVLLRKPTIIHEQNVLPGGANKVLKRWVNRVAVSFQESAQYFAKSKTVLTGCPIKKFDGIIDRESALKQLGFCVDNKTLLVFGGSQGSKRINEEIVNSLENLVGDYNLQVIHITGQSENENLRKHYARFDVPVYLCEFFDDMNLAYAISDVVISRAGASTVMELAALQKPSVLIPYPHANNHQFYNAKVLERVGLSTIVEEKNLTTQSLEVAIRNRMGRREPKDSSKDELVNIYFQNANELLAKEVIQLIR